MSALLGLHPSLPNDAYHADDAASKSRLDAIARSPAHYYAQFIQGHREPPTPAMILGTATHCAVLEPQRFAQEYIVAPKFDRRTKQGKEDFAAFEKANIGKTALDPEDFEHCIGMSKSVRQHPAAAIILASGAAEQSFFWNCDGQRCKVRPDWLTADTKIIADLKTTDDARPAAFQRSVENYRYFVSAGMYLDGVEAVTKKRPQSYVFIVVEKTPPYAVVLYTASEQMIIDGAAEYRRNLATLRSCTERKEWPAYPDEVLSIDRPRWARTQEQFQII